MRLKIFFILFVGLVLMPVVYGTNAVYVTNGAYFVSEGLVDALEDIGFDVDIVLFKNIDSVDFSQYDLIVVGDEEFKAPEKIPVNQYPSIILNREHFFSDWGWSSSIGRTGGNSMTDLKNAQHEITEGLDNTITAYTQTYSNGAYKDLLEIAYLYKGRSGSKADVETVSTTKNDIDDEVIVAAEPQTQMVNGEIKQERGVFFGVYESDYWTGDTEQLFKNAVCWILYNDCDKDGAEDSGDNCLYLYNPDQEDSDGDGLGDACDDDKDNDGILNDNDNCPLTPNTGQENFDGDSLGDVCDDSDSDGIFDNVDNCPLTPNQGQADMDHDGIGDVCDDSDSDTIFDADDNCPTIYNPSQEDYDGDGIGDVCDSDKDGDGYDTPDDCDDYNENINPGAVEICNGLNDDCNAATPDGSGETVPFNTIQEGVCAGSFKTCSGVSGWTEDYSSVDNYEAVETNCDFLDNDCDGVTDEDASCVIECDDNADCGTNGFVGNTTCSGDDVYQDYSAYTCSNPGTYDAQCSYTLTSQKVIDCGEDSYSNWSADYCKANDIYNSRSFYDRGCNAGACFETATIQEELVFDCKYSCSDGACSGSCTNGEIQLCPLQQGVCVGSIQSCINNVWPGCSAANYGLKYQTVETSCDSLDNDCDGQIDEGLSTTYYQDSDGDGYGKFTVSVVACSVPTGYVINNGDCDDADANVNPGEVEACNFVDDNCDGVVDEGCTLTCSENSDCGTNGFVGATSCSGDDVYQDYRNYTCNNPGTYSSSCPYVDVSTLKESCTFTCSTGACTGSCADGAIRDCPLQQGVCKYATETCVGNEWPGCSAANYGPYYQAAETNCDFLDNDCDGQTDEGCLPIVCNVNSDCGADGWVGSTSCSNNDVYQNWRVNTCNSPGTYNAYCSYNDVLAIRQDCGNDEYSAWSANYCLADDVYRSRTFFDRGCSAGACFETQITQEEFVLGCVYACSAGACTGSCTNGATQQCILQQGVCAGSIQSCINNVWPGCSAANYGPDYESVETTCDGLDNDCDGFVDEGLSTTYYQDSDYDGYGKNSVSQVACSILQGYTINDGDCNDANANVNPGEVEACNFIDDDCDTLVDEGFDADSDNYKTCEGDCDDTNANVNPGETEDCFDGFDNDCNGDADEEDDACYIPSEFCTTVSVSSHGNLGSGGVIASCPAGKVVFGGGWSDYMSNLDSSYPSGNGWYCDYNENPESKCYAICCSSDYVETTVVEQTGVLSNGIEAQCPAEYKVVSGGFEDVLDDTFGDLGGDQDSIKPETNAWYCYDDESDLAGSSCYAVCAKAANQNHNLVVETVSEQTVLTQDPTNPINYVSSAKVYCPDSYFVAGGGFEDPSESNDDQETSRPITGGWRCYEDFSDGDVMEETCYAQCAKLELAP